MKNNKTLRQILTGLVIASLAGLVIMSMMAIDVAKILEATQGDAKQAALLKFWSLWIEGTPKTASDSYLAVNWKIGGAYLALALIALIGSILKLAMFTVPSIKEQKNAAPVVLDAVAIVGALFAIIAMFVPLAITEKTLTFTKMQGIITTAQALVYCGAPVALGANLVNGAIALKAAK